MSVNEEVANVFKKEADHKTQLDGLVLLLDKAFPTPQQIDASGLQSLVESVVSLEAGSMVVSRQFILTVLDRLDSASIPSETLLSVAQRLLDILQTRAISYEEQACVLRYRVAAILEKEKRFIEAAQTLIGIPVETCQKQMPAIQKMQLYLRIATLLLEGKDFQEAEQYVNRAGHHQGDAPPELVTKFKAIYARVLDCKRKFIEAAQRYYEVSLLPSISREEKECALVRSITCTVLASPGTPRTQMLSTLYKDERTHNLPIFGLLQKLFLDRLIKTTELAELENGFDEHQKADENGESIVRGVILEHNLAAVSLLYTSISLETLAGLLGIDVDKAEEIVVQMISTNRLPGTIDQIDGCIHFKGRSELRQFDDQILALCQQVNHVSDLILAAHPELALH